jgi:HD-like signal output (HDOD) protein/CheY-like chemotaxis protein
MKPEILFVGDEPELSSELRSALQSRGGSWVTHWAEGGAETLDLLAGHQIDVVVTDLGMPGVDGVALLDEVRHRYPAVARIVLSDRAERESVIAAAGTAQRFLAKPCDPEALAAALESILSTRALIADEHLRSILGGPENLPRPPAIYAELCELAKSPHASVDDFARVVERDVATTAELLKLVNSSFFGIVNEVTSVSRAITWLGLDVVQALVAAGPIFRSTGELPKGLDAAQIARQGIKACVAVRRAGSILGWDEKLIGQVSLAALLHDVGLLVLASTNHGAWATYHEIHADLPARVAQEQAFGCTIGRASAYILGLWGFHPTVVSALAEQPVALDDEGARASASRPGVIVAETRQVACGGKVGGSLA